MTSGNTHKMNTHKVQLSISPKPSYWAHL